jgi:hypothetical protein
VIDFLLKGFPMVPSHADPIWPDGTFKKRRLRIFPQINIFRRTNRKSKQKITSVMNFFKISLLASAKIKLQVKKVALVPSENRFLAALIKMWPTCRSNLAGWYL